MTKQISQTQKNLKLFKANTLDEVAMWVNAGAQVDAVNAKGATKLFMAARKGKLDIVEYLLQCGARPHCIDFKGLPLCVATAYSGSAPVLDCLLSAGMDPSLTNAAGLTALMVCPSPLAINVLVRAGVDPNHRLPSDGNTALHLIASGATTLPTIAIAALVEAGAKINSRNWEEATPLLLCVMPDQAQACLAAGADVLARDHRGDGVFHHLFRSRHAIHSEHMQLLFDAGADVLAENALGCRPYDELMEMFLRPALRNKYRPVLDDYNRFLAITARNNLNNNTPPANTPTSPVRL
jgi:ankyrin repeat protein